MGFEMKLLTKWTLLLSIGLSVSEPAEIILNTQSGPIRGTNSLSEDVDAFLGIPFAEPPVGELRFARPVPKAPWTDTYDATRLSPPCAQYQFEPYYFQPDVSSMSEDCLYLNLWTPKSGHAQGLRPVMVFIHGGAFSTSSASFHVYDGSRLASRGDVVVATINYRLGAFGFLLGNTEDAPGSMGLYDQVLAIEWIRDNAPAFGGDPGNIVLMGQSAGAYSVSVLMVSPLSKHLFRGVIVESSSAINPYMADDNARLEKNSHTVASVLGCANSTFNLKTEPASVIQCLKARQMEDITAAEKVLIKTNAVAFYPRTGDQLLPRPAADLYREGAFRRDLRVMTGIVPDEGTMMITLALPEYMGYYGQNRTESMTKYGALSWFRTALLLVGQKQPSELVDFYMSRVKNRTSDGYIKMLSDLLGDFVGGCGPVFLADFVSLKGNPVYFYNFAFRAASTPAAEWVGVTHLDELQYVFGNPFHDNFTEEEVRMSNLLMDRWSAFAKTGNPNLPNHIPWLRYSYHHRMYLNFGQEEETIRMEPNSRCEVWRKRFRADIDSSLVRLLRNAGLKEFDDYSQIGGYGRQRKAGKPGLFAANKPEVS